MTGQLSHKINSVLERWLPEQRLFLKSDTETRYIRLRPATQLVALVGSGLFVAWAIIASAVLFLGMISAGTAREQVRLANQMFEDRLVAMSNDRDARSAEAQSAQTRFNLALDQVSQMQARLLASEDRRRELETGIDVIQKTLRRTIKERDEARSQLVEVSAQLQSESGSVQTDDSRHQDMQATLAVLSSALADTATERDQMAIATAEAQEQAAASELDLRLMEERNDAIFDQLEQAVTVSMEPLDKMFKSVGLNPDSVLAQVRRGYSGQGGPLTPISLSTKSDPSGLGSTEEARANGILSSLDRMNMYRIASGKIPVAMPLKTSFRFTSGFGGRNDPLGRGLRRHEGVDLAGAYGSPIYATAEGTVVFAGWESGYGQLLRIRHDFGLETRYGHLARIRVNVGDKVSRGDRIGDMGSTGRSTGTHLHYEVRVDGTAKNPMTFLKAARNVF
ncbi:DUF5930 domain-containing protein [Tabrizicola sp. J26]|uniref:DUF5930 domain-containing protein n=1 Tax=Alitabrizicola rongguiensis TaxID=2909234 RepID=UPI001F459F7F|nr:M23 family metallopeptidase [Tabrizicola rongguiensis]MCF1710168.1 DUF5930 domain-containing protein [Tabrizicola rongguiensis]